MRHLFVMFPISNFVKLRRKFLVNDQPDAQISFYVFIFILTLYMYRAHRAYHQERQIASMQPLVTVNLCWWPCRVQVVSREL